MSLPSDPSPSPPPLLPTFNPSDGVAQNVYIGIGYAKKPYLFVNQSHDCSIEAESAVNHTTYALQAQVGIHVMAPTRLATRGRSSYRATKC